tara:strand:- start:208 stop:444 length:237 start_codon:yes stop_codon:yes gene_type:complete
MGEVELYKGTPKGWDIKRSYLILKKVTNSLSYGKTFETYKVVKRWSAQGYGNLGVLTDSLKDVEYNKTELSVIIEYKL